MRDSPPALAIAAPLATSTTGAQHPIVARPATSKDRKGSSGSATGHALGHRKQINLPSCPGHGSLKADHEPPGGVHAAAARPRLSSEVLAENIEQGVSVGGIQAAIGGCTGIVGVQSPNQPWVFLDDDPQGEIRWRRHAPPFKLPPATRQRSGQ